LYKDCALNRFASEWFGYEYKVAMFMKIISHASNIFTIWGAVYLSENNANKTRPCSA